MPTSLLSVAKTETLECTENHSPSVFLEIESTVKKSNYVVLCCGNMQSSPQNVERGFSETGLTGLPQMLPSLGLCEGGHLVELGVNAGVLEAPEMDALAVNHTI